MSVWSRAIIVNSHLSWVIVLPINERQEPHSGQSHTLTAAQGQIGKPLGSGRSAPELLRIVMANNGAVDFFQDWL